MSSILVRRERALNSAPVVSRPTHVPSAPSTDPSSSASRVKLPKLIIQPLGAYTKLNFLLNDGEMGSLLLFAVPLICEPLTCQPVSFSQESFDHLDGLHLADPSCVDIDILIGSDQYWELVMGKTLRGTSGPVAINTALSCVLFGSVTSSTQDEYAKCLVMHTL